MPWIVVVNETSVPLELGDVAVEARGGIAVVESEIQPVIDAIAERRLIAIDSGINPGTPGINAGIAAALTTALTLNGEPYPPFPPPPPPDLTHRMSALEALLSGVNVHAVANITAMLALGGLVAGRDYAQVADSDGHGHPAVFLYYGPGSATLIDSWQIQDVTGLGGFEGSLTTLLATATSYTDAATAAEALARTNADAAEVAARTTAVAGEATARAAAIAALGLDTASTFPAAHFATSADLTSEVVRATGVESNKADLVAGKVPTSQLPAFASVFAVHPVASQAAMLALSTAQVGDIAIRTDIANARFWLLDLPASTLGNWIEITADPTAAVDSINGHVGSVTLGFADVGAEAAGVAATLATAAQAAAIAAAAADATTKANAAQAAAITAAEAAAATDATTKANAAQAAAIAAGTAAITALGLGTMSKMTALAGNGTVITAAGALTVNRENVVDVTAAGLAMSLPAGQPVGTWCLVEKYDNTANLVTVTGNIRGVGASSLTLTLQKQLVLFAVDAAGSWWPIGGHIPLSTLDNRYQLAGSAVGAYLDTATLATSGPTTIGTTPTELAGAPVTITPVLGARMVEVNATVCVKAGAAHILTLQLYDLTAGAVVAGSVMSEQFALNDVRVITVCVPHNPGAGTRMYRPRLSCDSGTVAVTVFGLDFGVGSRAWCVQR